MTVQSELRAIAERNIKYMQRRDYAPSMGGYDCARLLELVPEWLEAQADAYVDNHKLDEDSTYSQWSMPRGLRRLAREWREMVGGK